MSSFIVAKYLYLLLGSNSNEAYFKSDLLVINFLISRKKIKSTIDVKLGTNLAVGLKDAKYAKRRKITQNGLKNAKFGPKNAKW